MRRIACFVFAIVCDNTTSRNYSGSRRIRCCSLLSGRPKQTAWLLSWRRRAERGWQTYSTLRCDSLNQAFKMKCFWLLCLPWWQVYQKAARMSIRGSTCIGLKNPNYCQFLRGNIRSTQNLVVPWFTKRKMACFPNLDRHKIFKVKSKFAKTVPICVESCQQRRNPRFYPYLS